MKKVGCLLVLVVLLQWAAFAQTHMGLGFKMGIPVANFRENTPAIGYGFNMYLFAPLKAQSPVYLGFEFNYLLYGYQSENFTQSVAGFNKRYELATTNSMIPMKLLIRLKPRLKNTWLHPYIEGFVGANYIFTLTTLTDLDSYNQNTNNHNSQSRVDLSDWAWFYGGSAGLMIGSQTLYADIRCSYLAGSQARYLDRRSIQFDVNNTNQVQYQPKTSLTDMIMPQLSLVFVFNEF